LSFPADRVQKLKDARSEAAKEIEAYKVQKQKDYEAYEAEVNTVPAFIVTGVQSSNIALSHSTRARHLPTNNQSMNPPTSSSPRSRPTSRRTDPT
jgi:hypothetical protein